MQNKNDPNLVNMTLRTILDILMILYNQRQNNLIHEVSHLSVFCIE